MFTISSLFALGVLFSSACALPSNDRRSPGPPPLPSSSLPQPAKNLSLVTIALGVGHQNYTCDATTGTFGTNVALASLYDATAYLSAFPAEVSTLSARRLTQFHAHPACPDDADYNPWLAQIGEHYFDVSTPNFDLYALNRFLSAKKAGDVAAPDPADDIDWLYLVDNGSGLTRRLKAVYRVETAGGKPPASCSQAGQQVFVPYVAQYWFYN